MCVVCVYVHACVRACVRACVYVGVELLYHVQVSDQNVELQEQVVQMEAKLSFAEQEKLRIQKVHVRCTQIEFLC